MAYDFASLCLRSLRRTRGASEVIVVARKAHLLAHIEKKVNLQLLNEINIAFSTTLNQNITNKLIYMKKVNL
jgi:hypothetical protein